MERGKLNSDQLKVSRLLELLLLFLAILFLSSCSSVLPVPQEMGNMALLRTFAVDHGSVDSWKITVSTGKQAKGLQGEQETPLILSGESASLLGACRQVEGLTDHTIFYGYIDQLLISEAVAMDGVEQILTYFASNSQLSLGTGIWLTQGLAQEVLTATEEEGAQAYLQTLVQEGKLGVAGITRKVGEVLSDIRENQASFIPILSPNDQGSLEELGYGMVRGDQFVSVLQGEDARGFALLWEHDQLLELNHSHQVYAMQLSQLKVSYHGEWDNQKLKTADVSLCVQGDLLEYPSLPTPEQQDIIVREAEKELERLCKLALGKLQSQGCDALGIGSALALKYPHRSTTLSEEWEEWFLSLEINVSVDFTLNEVGGY